MLSKSSIQLARSLANRKSRRELGLFVAEGPRLVGELLDNFICRKVFATSDWLEEHDLASSIEITQVTQDELSRISLQQCPNKVLALFKIPKENYVGAPQINGIHLALDNIQDPGNMGTIIRIADWFGIEHIWCSPTTVDVWNPKVVQASMGGIARVRVHYIDLCKFLQDVRKDVPIFGTSLSGVSIWEQELAGDAIIVMGNEGNGISQEVDALCTQRLLIPNFPEGRNTTDSLNVAMATGIVLAEFRRREIRQ